jgi:chemotaxis protein methyltransferase CheR
MTDFPARLAAVVLRHTGIATKDQQHAGLGAALLRVAPEREPADLLAELERHGDSSPLLARLVDQVTIKETYFNRAPAELAEVPWPRLRDAALARGSHVVRVWASACATGEEAYTLAMLAAEALGEATAVDILATDISDAALVRAREAVYSDRAVAQLPEALRRRYLTSEGGRHAVHPALKARVRFAQHNLVADPVPEASAYDMVACRNVLIYFDTPTVERVMGSLLSALVPGGHLMLGAADALSGTAGSLARAAPARLVGARRRADPPAVLASPRRAPAAPGAPFDPIAQALAAADAGDLAATIAQTTEILADDPLNPEAHFIRGLAELGSGAPRAALSSFRRALFLDPSFGLAAFQLARASDAVGDDRGARRACAQALRALGVDDDRHEAMLGQVALADVADACRTRLLAAIPAA